MTDNNEKIPGSSNWIIDQLRFTIFLKDKNLAKPPSFSTWWEKLTGSDERDINYNTQQKVYVESGPFNREVVPGMTLQISSESGKCEFRLFADPNNEIADDELYNIGKLAPRIKELSELIEKWVTFENCPESTRIAMGAILLQPVETKEAGYEALSPFISKYVKLDPDSSDFRYHVNRRRQSTVRSDVEINRLAHWFVWVWQRAAIELNVANKQVLRREISGNPQFAVRADLDINTVPGEEVSFTASEYSSLWNELATLAIEIAEKGDHK